MKRTKTILTILLLASGIASKAQNKPNSQQPSNPKLIAVVNKASWCAICKANGPRFEALILPYKVKGLVIYMNDLTNSTTKAASKSALQDAHIYEASIAVPRKGMGKLLESCGLAKGKTQASQPSGIVTFIDPKNSKQLKQISIASADKEIQKTIESLLK